jgi:hypothetical protein
MKRQEIGTNELKQWLKDKRIKLDCGHKHCQHIFSNTMIVHTDGRIECFS